MIALAILNLSVGAATGMRLKFFALVPLLVLAMVEIAIIGVVQGRELLAFLPTMFLASTALQFGYLIGALGRPTRRTVVDFATHNTK